MNGGTLGNIAKSFEGLLVRKARYKKAVHVPFTKELLPIDEALWMPPWEGLGFRSGLR
jgi:hypothetical protein